MFLGIFSCGGPGEALTCPGGGGLTSVSSSVRPHSAAISSSVVPSGCRLTFLKFSSRTRTCSSDRFGPSADFEAMAPGSVPAADVRTAGWRRGGGSARGSVRCDSRRRRRRRFLTHGGRARRPNRTRPQEEGHKTSAPPTHVSARVCLLAKYLTNHRTDLKEIFRK